MIIITTTQWRWGDGETGQGVGRRWEGGGKEVGRGRRIERNNGWNPIEASNCQKPRTEEWKKEEEEEEEE